MTEIIFKVTGRFIIQKIINDKEIWKSIRKIKHFKY